MSSLRSRSLNCSRAKFSLLCFCCNSCWHSYSSGSPSVVPRSAGSTSSGNLLETQILAPHAEFPGKQHTSFPLVALSPTLLTQLSMNTLGPLLAVFSCHKSSFFAMFNLLCCLSQPLLLFLFFCLIDFHVGFVFRKL